jgi:hypothetical protein
VPRICRVWKYAFYQPKGRMHTRKWRTYTRKRRMHTRFPRIYTLYFVVYDIATWSSHQCPLKRRFCCLCTRFIHKREVFIMFVIRSSCTSSISPSIFVRFSTRKDWEVKIYPANLFRWDPHKQNRHVMAPSAVALPPAVRGVGSRRR